MKRIATIIGLSLFPLIGFSQITVLNPAGDGGFETGGTFALNNWTVANAASNQWQVGAATVNAGARAAYVSNDGGATNGYNAGQFRVSHIYRDIVFPAGNPTITLSFNWKCVGETANFDWLRAYIVPTSTTPVGGGNGTFVLASGQIGGTYNGQSTWQTVTMTLPCAYAGTTQRLVFTWKNDGSVTNGVPAALDNVSIVVNTAGACSAQLGTGFTAVAALPYASGAGTTCGFINDQTAANLTTACGSNLYNGGEDRVWEFTPTASGQITCAVASTGSWVGLTLFAGCPVGCGTPPTCMASAQSSAGSQAFCVNVVSGTTYYLIVDSWPAPACNAYTNVTISAPSGAGAGNTCATSIAAALPYTATGHSTVCAGNDYTNASTGSCGTIYESGEDMVYAVTVGAATCIGIALTNCSSANIGYQVYSGCPGVGGTVCVANNGGTSPLTGSVVLPAAGTYYVIVDSWSAPFNVSYDIAITSLGAGPANDLPCNATALSLNVNLSGDNSCTGGASEPGAATCWTGGNINTVWYSVVCPASGQLRVRTTVGTLANTQIALYSGTCGALVQVACNDNAPACGTSVYNNSEISAAGLTGGATYFIRVDGTNNLTGTFDVQAVDGTVGFPPAAGQDCSSPNPVCAQNIAIGNPGYQAYGNICDFPGGAPNCLLAGERGSVWYNVPINAAGNLTFDVVPNDWPGAPSTASTDYDFAVWKTAGAGSTTCAGIAAGAAPIRCNYDFLGVTGCFGAGNSPAAYPGFNTSYESQIPVVAGEVYVIVVSNFSNSSSGFTIDFGAAAPVNYTAAGSTVTWTGGNNTNWNLAANWGGCTPPICGISAVVGPSSSNQPILIAGTYYVNDLTINPGGVLTLQAGANLHICGNFTNSGSIVANPASTITFDNAAATHTITGAFVGVDAIGNLVVNQTGGSVILASNIDVKGNFTTSNATSVFNINGRYMKVAGNFSNNAGNTTFTGIAGSTLEFNGTGAQTYSHGSSGMGLNNVLMNHTGPGLTLLTGLTVGASGTLTLTSGKIITNAFQVNVNNTASAACNAGNATSFVQGNLRRSLNGAATSYDFPVGSATTGYQLANITFTTATTIPMLTARFDNYAPPLGPAANECPNNTYNTLPLFNNGYWTISASANPTSGTYDATLYPTTVSNNTGLGWTVVKGATTATFGLNGTCAASTAGQVIRTGMNGFSVFGIAQSTAPLPVEFISFTGSPMADYNNLTWSTATETNSQYFYVERSDDGIHFNEIGRRSGAGTSSQIHNYDFQDYSPLEGTNYYRLRQVDFNGGTMYSAIISIEFHRGLMTVTNVMPNPTNGELNFDFNSPSETVIHMVITDMTGRIVRDEFVAVKPGTTTVNTIIMEGSGVYSLLITEEKTGFRSATRVVRY